MLEPGDMAHCTRLMRATLGLELTADSTRYTALLISSRWSRVEMISWQGPWPQASTDPLIEDCTGSARTLHWLAMPGTLISLPNPTVWFLPALHWDTIGPPIMGGPGVLR